MSNVCLNLTTGNSLCDIFFKLATNQDDLRICTQQDPSLSVFFYFDRLQYNTIVQVNTISPCYYTMNFEMINDHIY